MIIWVINIVFIVRIDDNINQPKSIRLIKLPNILFGKQLNIDKIKYNISTYYNELHNKKNNNFI